MLLVVVYLLNCVRLLLPHILPGSSVHGIFQVRTPEWVAISFSRGSFRLRDQTHVSWIAGGFFTDWAARQAPRKQVRGAQHALSGLTVVGWPRKLRRRGRGTMSSMARPTCTEEGLVRGLRPACCGDHREGWGGSPSTSPNTWNGYKSSNVYTKSVYMMKIIKQGWYKSKKIQYMERFHTKLGRFNMEAQNY